jgi:aromatic ring hydroxylase
MPRTGHQYLSDLAARPRTIWLGDARITDPTAHHAFERTARSFADLYGQANTSDRPALRDRAPRNECRSGRDMSGVSANRL